MPTRLHEMVAARGDGSYQKILRR
ncbi:hypothetical protein DFAR_2210001 [Desulfarculales bacterium]